VIVQEAITTFPPTLQATIQQRRLKNIFLKHDKKYLLTLLRIKKKLKEAELVYCQAKGQGKENGLYYI